jgi:hypothetical protein
MVEMREGRVIGIFVRSVPGLMLVTTNQFQIGLNSSFFNCFFFAGIGRNFFSCVCVWMVVEFVFLRDWFRELFLEQNFWCD